MVREANFNLSCVAAVMVICLVFASCGSDKNTVLTAATPEQKSLDTLLAPIALYPDALLAQVLACSTSPQQVTEVSRWLRQNQGLYGTQLQQAAESKGFDASFVALTLFPDVINLLAQNLQWTTELGKVFISDQRSVLESAQRLRAQASALGNLKTTQQQEVRKEKQNGQQVIVIQPANPQVVYVPQYNPETIYTSPPPAAAKEEKNEDGKTLAAGLIGFGLGVALGAAINDDHYYAPYGYGAWGMGWHSHTVVVHHGAWYPPPAARYPYTRPTAHYRPPVNVYAPTNINVNRNRNTYASRATPYSAPASPRTRTVNSSGYNQPATYNRPAQIQPHNYNQRPQPATSSANYGSRGYGQSQAGSTYQSGATQQAGTGSTAFSGYQNGGSERAASLRGQRSVSSSRGGRRTR